MYMCYYLPKKVKAHSYFKILLMQLKNSFFIIIMGKTLELSGGHLTRPDISHHFKAIN